MNMVNLPIGLISAPDYNPNSMDEDMRAHLRTSIKRFGIVVPIVVCQIGKNIYETVGGAQRLTVLKELKYQAVACVVVDADDIEARLLCQTLNHIAILSCSGSESMRGSVIGERMTPGHTQLTLIPC